MDPDPGGPKTRGSGGSGFGSATLSLKPASWRRHLPRSASARSSFASSSSTSWLHRLASAVAFTGGNKEVCEFEIFIFISWKFTMGREVCRELLLKIRQKVGCKIWETEARRKSANHLSVTTVSALVTAKKNPAISPNQYFDR
jgi:hypothetical protein